MALETMKRLLWSYSSSCGGAGGGGGVLVCVVSRALVGVSREHVLSDLSL